MAIVALVVAAAVLHAPATAPASEPANTDNANDQSTDQSVSGGDGGEGMDGGSTGAQPTNGSAVYGEDHTIYFFYGNGCPHCAAIEPYVDQIAAKYPQFKLVKLEVWDNSTNQGLYQAFNQRYGVTDPLVPTVFLADKVMIAEDAIQDNLEPTIQRVIASGYTIAPPPATA